MKNVRSPILGLFIMIAAVVVLVACGSESVPVATSTAQVAASGGPVAAETGVPPTSASPAASPPSLTPLLTVTPTPTPALIPLFPPTPTATVAPAASPIPPVLPTVVPLSPELADVSALELGARAIDFLERFTRDASPQASGTDLERAAAEYLVQEFESLGYETSLQPFTVDMESATLLVGPEATEFRSLPMTLSGIGQASALLVNAGQAFEENIAPGSLEGRIALIQRGVITFEEKVTRVTEAGALGAVIYNNEVGLFRGNLTTQAGIPVDAVSRESGEAILGLMETADVEATLSTALESRDTQNVTAERLGTAENAGVVILGGHYDTVPNVPGANDNGSGIATLATIAGEVSGNSYPFSLRFIAFGSEELGLLGNLHYVDSLNPEDRESVVVMMNFDALGTGDVVGVLGDFDLSGDVVEYALDHGIDAEQRLTLGPGSSSDHASFQRAGIPVVFFLADDFSRIHTSQDKLEFVQPELLGGSAALAVALLDMLARR